MRGARLLQTLLLLQNRGRLTSAQLAEELEVSQRTVLRDLDAMTEAGLPIVVFQGAGGGIELGFNYRSQLTALTHDEAEALALILTHPHPALAAIERAQSARRAANKIAEAQAPAIRDIMRNARHNFDLKPVTMDIDDVRIPALARAVRNANRVTLNTRSANPIQITPQSLRFDGTTWWIKPTDSTAAIPQKDWGDLVISTVPGNPRFTA